MMRACERETRLSRRMRWLSGWRPIRNGRGSTGTRLRLPLGSTTTIEAEAAAWDKAGSGSIWLFSAGIFSLTAPHPLFGGTRRARFGGGSGQRAQVFHLAGAQGLAVGAIAADFGAGEEHLKSEVALD